MPRVVIVHGYGASPNANWFPWLAETLEERGIACDVPNMPDSASPKREAWLAHLRATIGDDPSNTILVGHSLGCIAILRYLEALSSGVRACGAILVSGFDGPVGYPDVDAFAEPPIDHARVRASVREGFLVAHSETDPVVPLARGEALREHLDARFLRISDGEHLNMGSRGDFTFPELMEEIEQMFSSARA